MDDDVPGPVDHAQRRSARRLRPVSGTPSVLFAWSGTGLDALGTYKGTKGTRISWG
jgi:hypothetical protein